MKNGIFPVFKITVHLYNGMWCVFGFSVLLPLTDGRTVIGAISISYLLYFWTLTFHTIKFFMIIFFWSRIFLFHHWWLKSYDEYLQISLHQLKSFMGYFYSLAHYFLSLTFAGNQVTLIGRIPQGKRSESGAESGLGLHCARGHFLPWDKQWDQLLRLWQEVSTHNLINPHTSEMKQMPYLLDFLSLTSSLFFLPILIIGLEEKHFWTLFSAIFYEEPDVRVFQNLTPAVPATEITVIITVLCLKCLQQQ